MINGSRSAEAETEGLEGGRFGKYITVSRSTTVVKPSSMYMKSIICQTRLCESQVPMLVSTAALDGQSPSRRFHMFHKQYESLPSPQSLPSLFAGLTYVVAHFVHRDVWSAPNQQGTEDEGDRDSYLHGVGRLD